MRSLREGLPEKGHDVFEDALKGGGSSIEKDFKAEVLRSLGKTEADGVPAKAGDSNMIQELKDHTESIIKAVLIADLREGVKARRLSPDNKEKMNKNKNKNKNTSKKNMAPPPKPQAHAYHIVTEADGTTTHHISFSDKDGPKGPLVSTNGGDNSTRTSRKLLVRRRTADATLGQCKPSQDLLTDEGLSTTAKVATSTFLLATAKAYNCKDSSYKCYKSFDIAASGEEGHGWFFDDNAYTKLAKNGWGMMCEVCESRYSENWAFQQWKCPNNEYPGITSSRPDSSCSWKKDTLPVTLECTIGVAFAKNAVMQFKLKLVIGFGESGKVRG